MQIHYASNDMLREELQKTEGRCRREYHQIEEECRGNLEDIENELKQKY